MGEIHRVGIIGDGQLARMTVEDGLAYNPDLEFGVIGDAGPNSPAGLVGAKEIKGSIKDPEAIRQLVEQSDVTTIEIDHPNAKALIELEEEGHVIHPSPRSILTVQDKHAQKLHLQEHGVGVAPFVLIESPTDLATARDMFGGELMVKARRDGYDGRGNYRLPEHEGWEEVEAALADSLRGGLYAEKIVPFKRELALVGARDVLGNVATYRVVETRHVNNICHTVIASDSTQIAKAAEELGRQTIGTFDGAGVITVEMFETEDDEFLVNEVALRVHNSGHWTDLGAATSQFEQHVRAITGDNLGSTQDNAPAAVMVNILRTKEGVFEPYMYDTQSLESGRGHVRWYGKAPRPEKDRKIGHITALGYSTIEAFQRAEYLQQKYAQ